LAASRFQAVAPHFFGEPLSRYQLFKAFGDCELEILPKKRRV
jgi:hypothetical protein